MFDTNVLISALVFGGLPRALLIRAFRGEITLVTSSILLNELEEILVVRFAHDASLARTVRAEIELLAEVGRRQSSCAARAIVTTTRCSRPRSQGKHRPS